jgi:hypothetical protein
MLLDFEAEGVVPALLAVPLEFVLPQAASASAPAIATAATFMTLRKGFSFRCAPRPWGAMNPRERIPSLADH